MIPIKIRLATSEDLDFIFSSWLRSYHKEVPCRTSIYYYLQHALIETILANSSVLVATPEEDSGLVAGYLVFEASSIPIIHWCYTRQSMRRLGVMRELFKWAGIEGRFFHTHTINPTGTRLARRHGGEYNPYLLMRDLND